MTQLFEITEANLESGLRGVPVGYCVTSFVDPQEGLYYAEKPVKEVAFWEPERVIYLLLHGKEGNDAQVAELQKELRRRAHLSSELVDSIRKLPRQGDPMKLFSAALLLLGMLEGKHDYHEDMLDIMAKIPLLTAEVINHHAGWGITAGARNDLGYMENFAKLLLAPQAHPELPSIFKLFNVLHYDHGGGNLSAFVAKSVASGLEDMYGSIAAGINALAGKRHGGANQECLLFVQEAVNLLGKEAKASDVERFLRTKLEQNELIFGFGHAVLRVEDPRATILYTVAEKYFAQDPLVKMAFLLRSEGIKVLQENKKISCPYPNVDAISGTVLSAAGFAYAHYFPLLFGLSRTIGIAIQIVYERLQAREGKGTPIMRPKYPFKKFIR